MFLEKVVEIKRKEILQKKTPSRMKEMEEILPQLLPPRDFMKAFPENGALSLVAEVKQASPSAGVIRKNADFSRIAKGYQSGGAKAISVLTESHFFQGTLHHLSLVREEVDLPVLQKDFIIDPFQIYEGRMAGADAILLIAAILDRHQIQEYVRLARSLGLAPLVEVHNEDDLGKISQFHLPFIGINNRDLKTLVVDLATTFRLMEKIPGGTTVISESGIKTRADVERLQKAGVQGILVGEALMRASDPAVKIRELLGI